MVLDPKQGPLRTAPVELVQRCRWCRAVLLVEDVYCPICGRAVDYGEWIK